MIFVVFYFYLNLIQTLLTVTDFLWINSYKSDFYGCLQVCWLLALPDWFIGVPLITVKHVGIIAVLSNMYLTLCKTMKCRQLVSVCLLVFPLCSPVLIYWPLCGRCLWAATSVASLSPTAAQQCLIRVVASASMVSVVHQPNLKSPVAQAAGSHCHVVPCASWTWAHLSPTAQVTFHLGAV